MKRKLTISMVLCLWMIPLLGKLQKQIPASQFSDSPKTSSNAMASPASSLIQPNTIFSIIGKPEYHQDILPHDFSYLTHLLKHAKNTQQPRNYTRLTLQLFSKLIKGSPALNAYSFDEFLGQFNIIIKPCFSIKYPQHYTWLTSNNIQQLSIFERLHTIINPLLCTRFNDNFDQFKDNPLNFLENLTQECITLVRQEITIQQLRNMVIRFLEVGLNKLAWNPEDGVKIWENIKNIDKNLHALVDKGILEDDNDLDDLEWSLIHRITYFIDLFANDLDEKLLTMMKDDIASETLQLCSLEEQEAFLETKKACLMRAITSAYAKKQAYQSGILVS